MGKPKKGNKRQDSEGEGSDPQAEAFLKESTPVTQDGKTQLSKHKKSDKKTANNPDLDDEPVPKVTSENDSGDDGKQKKEKRKKKKNQKREESEEEVNQPAADDDEVNEETSTKQKKTRGKKSKPVIVDDESEEERELPTVQADDYENDEETSVKQKKTRGKKKPVKLTTEDGASDDEIEKRIQTLAMNSGGEDEEGGGTKKGKKKKQKKKPSAAPTSAFSVFAADSDSDSSLKKAGSGSELDPELPPQPIKKKDKKKDRTKKAKPSDEKPDSDNVEPPDSVVANDAFTLLPADSDADDKGSDDESFRVEKAAIAKKGKKDKKKTKAKPDKHKEEDLDAIFAELNITLPQAAKGRPSAKSAVDTPEEKLAEGSAPAEVETSKKKKKKGNVAAELVVEDKKVAEEPSIVNTAALSTSSATPVAAQPGDAEEGTEPKIDGQVAGETTDAAKKKKKKKKEKEKKAPEEKEDLKKKPPANKALAVMKEALARAKEEEERLQREEEEKEKRAEEARRKREEEARLKEERRLLKKQKEKEKLARKKQEGTFMTAQQRADKEKALQLLQALGVEVPKPGAEKPKLPFYGKPKKQQQKPKQAGGSAAPTAPESPAASAQSALPDTKELTKTDVKPIEEKPIKPQEVEPEVKDSWEEAEEPKDAWDVSSEDEAEQPTPAPASEPLPTPKLSEKTETDTTLASKTSPAAREESEDESEEEETSSEEEEEEEEDSSDSEQEDEESSSDDEEDISPKERALARIMKRQQLAETKRSTDKLRAPVVCVLGHVDTGKTKILDKLRKTNVQDGEAGGITQQIGATNVPRDAIEKQTSYVKDFSLADLKVPGLLIIDTPGHESFSNLRTRGSSLCDIAILVIDIMHGLEPQTIESINLLKKGKTPFIVALNKIDRLYGWKTFPNTDVQQVIKKQPANTKIEFDERARAAITQLAEQGLNAALYYENPNPREYVSLIPTSAHTGEGMGNLIALICQLCQTMLAKRIAVCDDLQATVMEVKALPGLGTTVDVILVNGKLCNGDVVVLPGVDGPIVTHIRELLMPEPMRELRVKSQFKHHKEVEAAQGVKIVGKDLDKVMAGLPMYVARYQDEIEVYKDWISEALKNVLNAIKLSRSGVFVQASTLGSLEALLEYLRSVKVPYAGINIGPVHKKDVMRASVMVDHSEEQYAVILAFDVKVEHDAQVLADSTGVKIFTADIIYHLFDAFTKYQEELVERGRRENNHLKVFPCKIRILPQYIFNSRDPIVVGVIVEAGFVVPGTPICIPSKEFLDIGVVTSIERENKVIEKATKGMEVCIKIENIPGSAPKMYGRHFEASDLLVSKISRDSIDAVKKYFKKDMSKDDWKLIIDLKKEFDIL